MSQLETLQPPPPVSRPAEPGEVTRELHRWAGGDPRALDRVVPVLYRELRRLAGSYLRDERSGHTLQPTALVHEAFLRLVRQRRARYRDRGHFLAVAATLMRRILVDHARRRRALRRGEGAEPLSLDGLAETLGAAGDGTSPDLLALDRALTDLARHDAQQARLVELRFFGGLTEEETARLLGVTARTVRRRWTTARLWLYRYLAEPRP